jgi:hypothetical protein
MTTAKKPKSRPFKKFYCDRDETFLLPLPAFKLWMFYYRLEGAKREGWATRETICAKCDLDKDTVTKWRGWLVTNGWLRKVGDHHTLHNPLASSPIMQVTRGTIPAILERRGKSKKSQANLKRGRKLSVTDGSGNFQSPTATETTGATATETTGATATGGSLVSQPQQFIDEDQQVNQRYFTPDWNTAGACKMIEK